MKLETAKTYMNAGTKAMDPALLQRDFDSISIDSREVKAGDVFFALSQPEYKNNCFNGEFADSTVYVPGAFEKGALACVVRPDRFEEHRDALEQFADRLFFVDDVILALQHLAKGVYEEWGKPVVAVTGSAGKTTAKELIAHVLRSGGKKILSNVKNYNNGLGLPLTVLRLLNEHDHEFAVLEMGMSTPMNEIARLCRITPPDVAVELNVLPVHLEHLGSIENIAKAKAELVEGMKPGGTAILNADDERVAAMSGLSKGKTYTYGLTNPADFTARDIVFPEFGKTSFTLVTPGGEATVNFPLNGRHNVLNGLAAAAAGYSAGMNTEAIAAALESVKPPPQRGEIVKLGNGATVVNDSYNSNPDALLSMVRTLVEGAGDAPRKIVVAGEMRELGPDAAQIHYETGLKLAGLGIDALYGVEGLAMELLRGANDGGLEKTKFYSNSEAAGEEFPSEVSGGDVILVKGSRGVKTERVVEGLVKRFG